MLTTQDRRDKYSAIQTTFHSRAKNLRRIIDVLGWHRAARITGKSIQLLKQVCGDNKCRTIGDTLARELEFTLRLSPHGLDQ